MAIYRVTNATHRRRAFKVAGGLAVVGPGEADTIQDAERIEDARIEAFGREGVTVEEVTVGEPAYASQDVGDGSYIVEDKGRGWYVITKDGEEITKSLRSDDVDEFETMGGDDKAAFVALHAKV